MKKNHVISLYIFAVLLLALLLFIGLELKKVNSNLEGVQNNLANIFESLINFDL
ncbi:hypothetical protein [Peribacillus deserti]|uniref:hypothetical protein n=1 Tax=Peribacillus deserti TaxID=673318 RepID=UPI0015E066CD|nr:hypothetical protein [Peribacillus deserti]